MRQLWLGTFAICLAWLGAFESVRAQAPEGFLTTENRPEGFTFYRPASYSEMPLPPGESTIIARYIRKDPNRLPDSNPYSSIHKITAEIWILSIQKPPPPTTTSNLPPPTDGPKDREPDKADPVADKTAAHSFDEFVTKRMESWKIVTSKVTEERGQKKIIYTLTLPGSGVLKGLRAMAWVLDRNDRLLVLMGLSSETDFDRSVRAFETSAQSLREIGISNAETERWERSYRLHPEFKDPAFRLARRKELVSGWQAIDTINYLIVHHTADQTLLTRVRNGLETIRSLYEKLFPSAQPIEAVSVVRVCKNREEYLYYGGHPTTVGFWNAARHELVLYDNIVNMTGNQLIGTDSCLVLYHEAFHQYIFHSIGDLAPHDWFNEGYGDYFSGADMFEGEKRLKRITDNPWRLDTIKKAAAANTHVPLAALVRASHKEYYGNAPLFYAEGWSFIYFLNESDTARKHPQWSQIVSLYFNTLKDAWAEETRALGTSATAAMKELAAEKARTKALDAAFHDVDFTALEAEWKKFILLPRSHR
ncbi:MAG: hypothetical protein U1E76_14575 [Planctomycetota bacterium]